MIVTLDDYLMGREREHGLLLSLDMVHNANILIELVNKLLSLAGAAGVTLEIHPRTKTIVSSGWRPPAINEATANAAPRSKHLSCQAIDLYDPDGDLDEWLMTDDGQHWLTTLGLWMEHPAATKGWSHLQSLPPRSGRRVFYP